MQEENVGGHVYRLGNLNAFEQLHVVRRLMPLLHSGIFFAGAAVKSLNAYEQGNEEESNQAFVEATLSSKPFLIDFSLMSDGDLDYVIHTVLKHVTREVGGSWMAVSQNGVLMFDDLNFIDLTNLVVKVLNAEIRPILTDCGLTAIAQSVKATMFKAGDTSPTAKTS